MGCFKCCCYCYTPQPKHCYLNICGCWTQTLLEKFYGGRASNKTFSQPALVSYLTYKWWWKGKGLQSIGVFDDVKNEILKILSMLSYSIKSLNIKCSISCGWSVVTADNVGRMKTMSDKIGNDDGSLRKLFLFFSSSYCHVSKVLFAWNISLFVVIQTKGKWHKKKAVLGKDVRNITCCCNCFTVQWRWAEIFN